MLDLSHHAVKGLAATPPAAPKLTVNWTNEDENTWDARLSDSHAAAKNVTSVLKQHMPARLAAVLCAEAGVQDGANCATLSKAHRRRLLESLTRFELPYTEHAGCGMSWCCPRAWAAVCMQSRLQDPPRRHWSSLPRSR